MEKKKIYLEYLRIVACFFVIYHHTYIYPEQPVGNGHVWVTLFGAVFCCFSVPLFFMISGALLLDKEESLKDLWKKRILKTVITLVVFSFLYYMRLVILGYRDFDLINFFKELYSTNWNYSYWYLYAYIGYLICLPILRNLVKNLDVACFRYIFIIAICLMGVIPTYEWFLFKREFTLNSNLKVAFFTTQCIIYPLLGYYLERKVDKEKFKKYIPLAWTVNVMSILLTCYMSYCDYMETAEFTKTYYMCFVMINCVTIFMTFKCYFERMKSEVWGRVVTSLGSATLGIYLLHLMAREHLYGLLECFRERWNINDVIAVLMFDTIIFVVCYVITVVLKRIPGIKKII